MVNDNLVFDASNGPIMEGHWVNPKTGDTFTVRDSFFQDNQYIVQTTDGRMLDYNFIQNYIKVEKESDLQNFKNSFKNKSDKQSEMDIPDDIKNMIESPQNSATDSSQFDYSEYMTEEDKSLGMGNICNKTETDYNPYKPNLGNINQSQPVTQIDDEDLLFIKRVLKNTSLPFVNVSVKWDDIPVNKLDTLINILGVDIDNVSDWIINHMDLNEFRLEFRKSINLFIEQHITNQKSNNSNTDKLNTDIKSSPVKKTRRSMNGK